MVVGIYTHARPNGEIFYVGKGTKERAYLLKRPNKHHQNIVKKHKGKILINFTPCLSDEDAFRKEQDLIIKLRNKGAKLVNLSDGGEGPGLRHQVTEETKIKISEALMNREISPEWRAKISKALTGKTLPQEVRDKISKAGLGRKLSPAHIQRLKDRFTGRPISEEHKKKISQTLKGRKVPRERVERSATAFKEKWKDPIFREKMMKRRRKGQPAVKEIDP